MNDVRIRRYGDPAAPLFAVKRWVAVVAIAVVALVGVSVTLSAVYSFRSADAPNRVGTVIGIGLAALIVGGSVVGWVLYWRPLRRACRTVRIRHRESVVLGARLPNLDSRVLASTWQPQWGPALAPQRVILLIDNSGVKLLAVKAPTASLLELGWIQVKSLAPAEYVEFGVAYEGLAVEGPSDGSAIVLQIITPSLFVRFPRGSALAEIVERAADQRRQRDSSRD